MEQVAALGMIIESSVRPVNPRGFLGQPKEYRGDMTLDDLRVFVAVCQAGSLSAVARERSRGACPWNRDCHNCDTFVTSGADLLHWRRKREQWRILAEGTPARRADSGSVLPECLRLW